MELAWNLLAHWFWEFFKSGWNLFDASVVLVSIFSILGERSGPASVWNAYFKQCASSRRFLWFWHMNTCVNIYSLHMCTCTHIYTCTHLRIYHTRTCIQNKLTHMPTCTRIHLLHKQPTVQTSSRYGFYAYYAQCASSHAFSHSARSSMPLPGQCSRSLAVSSLCPSHQYLCASTSRTPQVPFTAWLCTPVAIIIGGLLHVSVNITSHVSISWGL